MARLEDADAINRLGLRLEYQSGCSESRDEHTETDMHAATSDSGESSQGKSRACATRRASTSERSAHTGITKARRDKAGPRDDLHSVSMSMCMCTAFLMTPLGRRGGPWRLWMCYC